VNQACLQEREGSDAPIFSSFIYLWKNTILNQKAHLMNVLIESRVYSKKSKLYLNYIFSDHRKKVAIVSAYKFNVGINIVVA